VSNLSGPSGPSGTPEPGHSVCYRHAGREANIRCQRCERPICTDCMRDASVGFQCPSCVSEGARTVRQAQAPYGGARSANPALTSYALIGINVAVWLSVVVTGWQDSRLIGRLALVPKGACESVAEPGSFYRAPTESLCSGTDARWVPGVADGSYWQLVSSMFMHVEIWHIAANMFSLFILGPQIEAVLGRVRFLALYLVSGLAGSTVVFWFASENGATLGASGAIFGLIGALAVIVHKIGGDLRSVGGLLLVNAFITFAIPNISWQGHLGGFLGGLAMTALIVYAPRGPRRSTVQLLGTGGISVLLVLAIIARSVTLA